MPLMEQRTQALDHLQGFTKQSLAAYAFERGIITQEELRHYLSYETLPEKQESQYR